MPSKLSKEEEFLKRNILCMPSKKIKKGME